MNPDIIVTDINMPGVDGIEAAATIRKTLPATKIIIYTSKSNSVSIHRALSSGANGYVLKSDDAFVLLKAIDSVMQGEQYVSDALKPELDTMQKEGIHLRPSISQLTPRQLQILQLIGNGLGNKEIAHILSISIKTVEFHRGRMMSHFRVQSITELVLLAAEAGLIQHPES